MLKNKEGFTLIEVLIVVVIIGLISNMAVVNFSNKTEDAKKVAKQGNMVNIRTAIELFEMDNGHYPEETLEGSLNILLGEGENVDYLIIEKKDLENYKYTLSEDKKSYTIEYKESESP